MRFASSFAEFPTIGSSKATHDNTVDVLYWQLNSEAG
jgi:hypothetical protein